MARRKRQSNISIRPLAQERDRLIDQWVRLTEQAEAMHNKIKGLELAMSIIQMGDGEGYAAEVDTSKPATNVKALLLDLALEAKAEGLNANISVKMAAKRGVDLKRGTAASNLSRLKTDGALVHDGKRYRLPQFVRPKSSGGFSSGSFGSGTAVGSVGVTSSGSIPTTFKELAEQTAAGWRPKGS